MTESISPAAEFHEQRQRLLEAVLYEVPFEGWSQTALFAGARAAGIAPTAAMNLFPGGPIEVLEFWHRQADAQMVETMAAQDLSALRFPERIALAIRTRLEQALRHREAVRAGLAYLSNPLHAATAARVTYATVDTIWRAIGDRSTDFSFYTKRASLAAVYGATVLFWLNDRSPGTVETWAFLDRRLADIGRIPRARAQLRQITDRLPNPFRLLRPPRFSGRPGGFPRYTSPFDRRSR
jgi:ubiquinone biosynthesis protein COQ9